MAEKLSLKKKLASIFGHQTANDHEVVVASPVAGTVLPLEEVEDPVFASGAMGSGFAVEPTDQTVYAPVAGEVTIAFETGHAYGLRMANGVEFLIHIGIDTVSLEGQGFEALVQERQRVEAGQVLAKFDPQVLDEAGLKATTMVIVSSQAGFSQMERLAPAAIKEGEKLFSLKRP